VTGPTLSLLNFNFASTRLGEGYEANNLRPPKQLTDADPTSAWVEGKGGAGQGEFLEARSPKTPYGIAAIRFIPGHGASRAAFTRHNRLRTFLVWLGPDQGYVVSVPADPAQSGKPPSTAYWVTLPKPVKTRCATVVLRSVYPGSSAGRGPGGQTAVSELTFLTELDLKGGIQRLLRDVDGQRVTREQAVFYLRRLDKKASGLLTAAFEKAGPRAKLALLEAFAEKDPSKYVNALVKGLPSAPPAVQVKLLLALARAKDAAVDPLGSLLTRKDVPGRLKAAVINTIGHIGTRKAALQLLSVFGRGHVKLRARAVKAAARLNPEILQVNKVLAWPVTSRPADRADRIWLSGLVARRNPGSRMGIADTLVRVWPNLKKFEPRFRLLQALGRTAGPTVAGSTGAAGQLTSRVEKLLTAAAIPASQPEELLRWAAVLIAGLWPSPGLSALLVRAASDRDPRVRLAALAGLAVRKHTAAAGLITRCIRKEPWPFVREGCLEALVRICPKGAGPHLAVMARKGGSLIRPAMYALAACRYPQAGSVLSRILRSKKSKPALAGYAAQLLAMVGDTRHGRFMLKLARKLSLAAGAHSGQEVLAMHLLDSLAALAASKQLAHLKGPLLRLALEIPGKTRSRRVHNKAIQVLGKFCPPAAKPVLIRSLKSPSRIIVFNAHHALRRCGWSP
jgi:HEAT repeat protein